MTSHGLGLLSRIALLSFCPHSFIKRPVKHELLSWTPPAPLLGQFHHPWSCHSTEYNALSTLFCCSVFPPISEELLKCRHCVWFSLGSLEPTHCLSYKRCSQAFHSKKKKKAGKVLLSCETRGGYDERERPNYVQQGSLFQTDSSGDKNPFYLHLSLTCQNSKRALLKNSW